MTATDPQYALLPVVQNREVAAETYLLTLDAASVSSRVMAGQFFMVSLPSLRDPLLPRPFAAFDCRGGRLEILYRRVGRGTRLLSVVRQNELVGVMGPLGRGFHIPDPLTSTPLVIAGGIGFASVHLLIKDLLVRGVSVECLYGTRSSDELVFSAQALRKHASLDLFLATEDGGVGYRGNLHELYLHLLGEDQDFIGKHGPAFLCGPMGMLKRFAVTLQRHGMAAQVSLESRMACGYGVCQGCVVNGRDPSVGVPRRYRKVCSDGPVFSLEEIDWGAL